MTEFSKNGLRFKIYQENREPSIIYDDRVLFIMNQNPINNKQLDEVVRYSKIFVNVKYLGCKYNDFIMKRLDAYLKPNKNN